MITHSQLGFIPIMKNIHNWYKIWICLSLTQYEFLNLEYPVKKFTKLTIAALMALVFSSAPLKAAEKLPNIGVVNFATCIQESKYGLKEQESLESIKNQLHKSIEDIQGQLNDTVTKLQDSDYLDTLNPEAEKELKAKFQALNEELNRYQAQYYQIMQQANMKLVQVMSDLINEASEKVAKQEKLSLVINREAAFHFAEALDITKKVIGEMDKRFDQEQKIAESTNVKDNSRK